MWDSLAKSRKVLFSHKTENPVYLLIRLIRQSVKDLSMLFSRFIAIIGIPKKWDIIGLEQFFKRRDPSSGGDLLQVTQPLFKMSP